MQMALYILSFMTGAVLGSFFTLAVYRLPLKQDILYKHSYCPKCSHKLGFFDLIPILSYLFLNGTCRHCGEKIKIRYLLFEVLSGITFLVLSISFKINIYTMGIVEIVWMSLISLFIIGLFLLGGINKETKKIHYGVVVYQIVILVTYMIYLCILKPDTYKYIIYWLLLTGVTIINIIALLVHIKNKFVENIIEKKPIVFYFSVTLIISIIGLNFIFLG